MILELPNSFRVFQTRHIKILVRRIQSVAILFTLLYTLYTSLVETSLKRKLHYSAYARESTSYTTQQLKPTYFYEDS
jgi:predicted unusual protein kinase regulating ubiquinone biosynthesis (AarF/ABC1/UbiB family)